MANNITLRKATLDDLETLRKFEQGVIEAERPYDPTIREGEVQYYDLEKLITSDESYLAVAEARGVLVGCGYARLEPARPWLNHTHYAYLGFMYVLPEYRGQGINAIIINALQQWALSRKVNELRLEVYSGNIPAIRAYEKVGFTTHLLEMRMKA